MKAKFITLVITLVTLSAGMVFGQAISLDNVEGLYGPGVLPADDATEIVFNFRFQNNSDIITGMTNGLRVYSDDGATWDGTIGDTLSHGWAGPPPAMFSTYSITHRSATGMDADTVGFGGVTTSVWFPGFPAVFDDIAFTITIGPIGKVNHNKTLCIDSSFATPANVWKWATDTAGDQIPTWDGPHCYTLHDETAGVNSLGSEGLPTEFSLSQNYPNPFNPVTIINFDLPSKQKVSLKIYNVLGQLVDTVVDEELPAGSYEADWDGTIASSGVYFYKIEAGSFVETKKMMLLK